MAVSLPIGRVPYNNSHIEKEGWAYVGGRILFLFGVDGTL